MHSEERVKKGMSGVCNHTHLAARRHSYAFHRPFVGLLKQMKFLLTPVQRELVYAIATEQPLPEDMDYITLTGNLNALVSERIIKNKWRNQATSENQPKLTPRGRQYFNCYLKEDYESASSEH